MAETTTFLAQLIYLFVSVMLTVWVALTLSRRGITLLRDVFRGNQILADSVNHLLVVGFYLLNLGFVCLNLRDGLRATTPAEATVALSTKVGIVLMVLGGFHLFNMWVLFRVRRNAQLAAAPPPCPPDARLTTSGDLIQPS